MDFGLVAFIVVRSFEDERTVLQQRMTDYGFQRICADRSLSELFVAVFARAAGIFAVIKMNCAKLLRAYDPVK